MSACSASFERIFGTFCRELRGKAGPARSLVALAACSALAGCARDRAPSQDVSLNDFRRPGAAAEAAPPTAADPAPVAPPAPPESTVTLDRSLGFAPERGPTGALEVVARPGTPEAPERAEAVAPPVIVDQKVGEINTKPVWAAEFLRPMAARLRQEVELRSPQEWRVWARDTVITAALIDRLRNELIVADTISRIPPAQRPGLTRVLEEVFRRERSARGGSQAVVEQELREENSSLGEAWQQQREDVLIQERQREWWRRVHVSADEVDLEYQRRYKEFNPDPRAIFRRIRIAASDEEAIARIQQRLESGEAFATVAEDPANRNNAEGGGLVENVGSFTGEYAEAEFWAVAELNEAARTLSEGEWTGPFEVGSAMNWLHLEKIERENISLYEARPQIRRELEQQRVREISEADLQRMFSQASFTDIDVMADRLLTIAESWYLEPALARRGVTPGAARTGR